MLAAWLTSRVDSTLTIFVDLPGAKYKQVSDIFYSVRPDMVIVKEKLALIVELTVCHETNLSSSKLYKENKYKDLDRLKTGVIADHELVLTTCELTVLGFLQFDSSVFKKHSIPSFDDSLINNISKSVIQSSFEIYTHRDVENV